MEDVQDQQRTLWGGLLDIAKTYVSGLNQQPQQQQQTSNGLLAGLDWKKLALIALGIVVVIVLLKKLL